MAQKLNPYIILDFETGGVKGGKENAITEVAMLCVDGGTFMEVGRYESYVQPYIGYEYEDKALEYTGITMDLLRAEGKPLLQVGNEMCELIKKWHSETSNTHTKKPVVVGHNIQFDISFLQQVMKESKNDISKYFDGKLDFYGKYYPDYLDTKRLAMLAFSNDDNFTSFKLGNCIQKVGLNLTDAHKAINDVIATKEMLIKFVNRLRNETGKEGGEDNIRLRQNYVFQL